MNAKAKDYLHQLCIDIPERPVGSAGNRAATDFFARKMDMWGFTTERSRFACLDWVQQGATLTAGDRPFAVHVSPYSLGGEANGPLVVVSTVDELAAADLIGKIVLLRGELTREQLMPKNFTFYNPDHHQRIIHLLETKAPLAIIAATSRNPELAGGIYPFPLIEDGDFDLPSVYMTAEEGEQLAHLAGKPVQLTIQATRIPAEGENIVARKGTGNNNQRVVVSAHIDAKINTPGALDNGTGVVVLLLLAEMLADYSGELAVELVPFNGEDYFAASGQKLYVKQNQDRWDNIVLVANIDLAGYHTGRTAYSLYNCPPDINTIVEKSFASRPDMVHGEAWYQGDHTIFVQQQVPALAITSDRFLEISATITHTPADRPELVNLDRVVSIAQALNNLIHALNEQFS